MVIKALIPLWKRPEITRICFEGIKRLQKTIEIDPVCIYSEQESKELCAEFGFESYYFENDPLGRKMNFGLDRALDSKWDYLITIGSDDLLSEALFEIYKPFMDSLKMAFGVGCIYFYDIKTGKQARQNGMQVYGCGRMIHREVLDKETYKAVFKYSRTYAGISPTKKKGFVSIVPAYIAERWERRGIGVIQDKIKDDRPLYTDSKLKGLDFDSEFRLNTRGINIEHVDIDKRPLILDIKNGTNLHDITEYEAIDFDVLTNFPEGEQIRGLL
jgi:hypothetical protein